MVNGLPERLKKMRMKCGMSQRQAAKRMFVSPSIISGYETGERTPSAENLLALSFLYKCSVDYLLGRESLQPQKYLDVTGLTDEQVRILDELINSMKK